MKTDEPILADGVKNSINTDTKANDVKQLAVFLKT